MKVTVDGNEVHLSTGGRQHEKGRPFILFLHGAGFNHFTWVLQSRALAYDGYNVVAADMPGHGFSGGKPLDNVEDQASWMLRLMEALGADEAILVGHSQGGLIALDMARQAPEQVRAIALVATAAAIPVNAQLIEQAETDRHGAFENMVDWAHGAVAHMHDNTVPGGSHLNFGVHVMDMGDPMALAADLKSCASYERGADAAASLKCPTMLVLAGQDKMTPAKAGRKLAEILPDNQLHFIEDSGHTITTERPRELNAHLRAFLKQIAQEKAA